MRALIVDSRSGVNFFASLPREDYGGTSRSLISRKYAQEPVYAVGIDSREEPKTSRKTSI